MKAKNAVDDVRTDYMGYYSLRDRQNAGAMTVLFLTINILAYLCNFMFIIMSV